MSKSNAWETALLSLLFTNANAANIGDATGLRGSSTAGSLYVSLHNADPTEAGDQTSHETAYTSYARVAVARSGAAWTVSGDHVGPVTDIDFPQCTAGSGVVDTITHFGIGTAASGAGVLLYSGTVTPNIVIANGTVPQFPAASNGSLVSED